VSSRKKVPLRLGAGWLTVEPTERSHPVIAVEPQLSKQRQELLEEVVL
jgi:hypothetical protein